MTRLALACGHILEVNRVARLVCPDGQIFEFSPLACRKVLAALTDPVGLAARWSELLRIATQ